MQQEQLRQWMEAYIRAWTSNDPQDIGQLFTQEGFYYTAPYREPWQGRQQIVQGWLGRKDDPEDFEFRYEILGNSESTGFVRGWTTYHEPPRSYSNLWVIRLDETGQCEEFIEWWMQEEE
jgi:hypothetical protein